MNFVARFTLLFVSFSENHLYNIYISAKEIVWGRASFVKSSFLLREKREIGVSSNLFLVQRSLHYHLHYQITNIRTYIYIYTSAIVAVYYILLENMLIMFKHFITRPTVVIKRSTGSQTLDDKIDQVSYTQYIQGESLKIAF